MHVTNACHKALARMPNEARREPSCVSMHPPRTIISMHAFVEIHRAADVPMHAVVHLCSSLINCAIARALQVLFNHFHFGEALSLSQLASRTSLAVGSCSGE